MNRILRHVLFWLIYLIFQSYIEFVWIKSSYEHLSSVQRFLIALRVELLLLIPKLFFAYALANILNSLKTNNKMWLFLVKLLFVFISSLFIYRLITAYIILPFIYDERELSLFSVIRMLTASLDIIAIAGVFQVIKLFKMQLENAQNEKLLIKAKLEAELNYLKGQTNPHFLFNTLNNIYGLSKKRPELSSEAILKLSKILRFMIYGTRKELISIKEELEVIENYIELEKLRYSNKLSLQFLLNDDSDGAMITPLILLPFVENAFKHGVSESTNESFIEIHCSISNSNELFFKVKNSKEHLIKNEDKAEEEGIGLANIKRQLSLLYKNYTLNIIDNMNDFEVVLFIQLNSYESI